MAEQARTNAPVRRALRALIPVFVVAFLLNFAWELAQVPLYEGVGRDLQSFLGCLSAAVGDAVFISVVYLALAAYHGSYRWAERRTWKDLLAVLGAGMLFAVGAELVATQLGWWTYSSSMPVVPVLGVGLSPFVQLGFLGVVTVEIVRLWLARREQK